MMPGGTFTASVKSAPWSIAPSKRASSRSAPTKFALVKVAFLKTVPTRRARKKTVSTATDPFSDAPERSAQKKSALLKSSASPARDRYAWRRFADCKSAPTSVGAYARPSASIFWTLPVGSFLSTPVMTRTASVAYGSPLTANSECVSKKRRIRTALARRCTGSVEPNPRTISANACPTAACLSRFVR